MMISSVAMANPVDGGVVDGGTKNAAQTAIVFSVPDAPAPDPIIEEMSARCGESVWYPVEGGHRVLMLYDGGAFDPSRFSLEPGVWAYDECAICCESIPPMTLCRVTRAGQPYFLLCALCYERHVAAKRPWWRFW